MSISAVLKLSFIFIKCVLQAKNCTYDREQSCKQALFLQNMESGNICQKILIVEADRDENFHHQTASFNHNMKIFHHSF